MRSIRSARNCNRAGWVELLDGKVTLRDLLDATQARYRDELHQPEPPAFLIYIDQGEELYVRAEERERQRFSEILAHGLGDPRLRALMSMRADFLGDLQNDEPLFDAHRQIDVPPLREAQLREVVSRPAALLSARFETDHLAADIARRTAEESTKDAGALPLLSYLLDDMWSEMVHAATACCACRRRRSSSAACWSIAPMPSSPRIPIPRSTCGVSSP